jgi:hypothetical protein
LSLVVLLAAGGLAGPRDQPSASGETRAGLDHIPIAVANLERAAEQYRALGFVLKPGRRHDNGIRNEHAKFPDGTELELITAPEARDDLTTTYRKHLAAGDGPAFLAFHAPAMSEAVHRSAPPYIFFGGLNRSPTDRPEHFKHTNGAYAFIGVWLAADDLSQERKLLQMMGAVIERRQARVPMPLATDVARLSDDEVVLLPARFQLVPGRRIVGATVAVKSLAAAQPIVERAAGKFLERVSGPGSRSVFVPPSSAHGLWLELRERSDHDQQEKERK